MKKVLFSLALLATVTAGCADNNKVHVSGNLRNVGDTLLVMSQQSMNTPQTVVVKDGQFEFDFFTSEPTTIYCVSPDLMRRQQGGPGVQLQLIAVPGESMELTGDVKDRYDINGSKFYKEYHEVDLLLEEAQKPQSELSARLQKMMAEGKSQSEVMDIWNEESPKLQEKAEQMMLDFIKAHPDYEASAAIVTNLAPEKMKEAVALLSPAVRDGRMKPFYQNVIDRMEAQQKAEEEAAKKQAAGVMAPDFTLNDTNGKPLALSSLRGKYVILDFWGSWCGWCIKGFPEMKNYYNKYKGKFEILGIDCNDTEAKWKEAVKKNELPWLHVYNPRDSKVLADYGIQGFPTKIIVGPDGKIVKTIVGEDPAFYTLLDELFQ